MDLLRWAYESLRDAWQDLSLAHEESQDAPWHGWRIVPDEDVVDATDILLQLAELDAAGAIVTLSHHLKVLATAYPEQVLVENDFDNRYWPGFASFTLARAVLEAGALAAWLLTPDPTERVTRSARVQLWSAGGRDREESDEGATTHSDKIRLIADDAGLTVAANRRGVLGLRIDGQLRTFHHSVAITALLDAHGKSLYHSWSAKAHQAPFALAPWTQLEVVGDFEGLATSVSTFEDKHIELAADVADVVTATGTKVAAYYAKDTQPFIDRCAAVSTFLRQELPKIRALLGRPDSTAAPGSTAP